MNYALDAIWWRLQQPMVRDLAAVLTAPVLWQSGQELGVAELLGEHGLRLLLQWDDAPDSLPASLHDARLGRYAEKLLAFWLEHAPHTRLLAVNEPVFADGRQLGAFDCIAEINGRIYHIELCCKYYGTAAGWQSLCGLNPDDRFTDKYRKLQQQLALADSAAGRETLPALGLQREQVHSVSLIRGMLFTPDDALPHEVFAANAWRGRYAERLPQPQNPDARYWVLSKTAYLAPARVALADTLDYAAAAQTRHALIAELALRPDGCYHEVARFMVKGNSSC